MLEFAPAEYIALGCTISVMMGGFGGFLYALVVFVVMDYVTGLMAAAVEKQFASEVCFKDIFKKVGIFCLVVVGYIVDTYIIGEGGNQQTAVIFYLFNKGISILENAPLPEKMKAVLEQLREGGKS
ncbi:MAG: phage holin family protein [Lachnospiraceae bacterium]|nr:phage holin family protein [Lachnospiraceae bacterium]